MQLLGALRLRPGLLAHARHRLGIEGPQGIGGTRIEAAARQHRLGAALLERGVVQEGVRHGVQDAEGEGRRLGRVDGHPAHAPVAQPAQDLEQPFDVHRLLQAVLDRLPHHRVIPGHRQVAGRQRLAAGEDRREGLRQQVVGPHAQERRRHPLAAAARARQEKRPRQVPAPAGGEERRGEEGLDQHVARAVGVQVVEDLLEREAVLRPQRQEDRLLVGGRLQLEAEAAAEALAQRQPPGAVDPPAERRVQHQLHAARLVEETLEDDALLRRHGAQGSNAGRQVIGELARGALVQADLAGEPLRVLAARAHPAHGGRQLARPGGRLAQPEGKRRRRPLRVGHPHHPRLDLQDPPGGVAELEDVAHAGLDGEVFVHRPDRSLLRLEQHPVIGAVGNGAARGERRQPRPARAAQTAVHAVAVQERRAPPGVQAHHGVEVLARQVAVRPGAPAGREEGLLLPGLGGAGGDHLLRQDVERRPRLRRAIQVAAADGVEQRRGAGQLVAREREEAALRSARQRVARPADALQERRDRRRDAHLDHQIDVADVDPQLERGGGHERAQGSGLEAPLCVEAPVARQAAVVARDLVLPQHLGEARRHTLGQLARVDEDERGAVLADQPGHAPVDFLPGLVRADGRQGRVRHLDREVEAAVMAGVDQGAIAPGADQQARRLLQRLLRRRQPDALQRPAGQRLEPLERQRQVRPALVAGDGVDLVHDDCAHAPQHGAPALAGQQDVERLRGRDQDVRRPPPHRRARRRQRVSRAHQDAHLRQRRVARAQLLERRLQVLLHVVAERFEGGDIKDLGGFGQTVALPHQIVDGPQEGCERLAGAGRGGDQDVLPGADRRPPLRLRRAGGAEALREPGAERG